MEEERFKKLWPTAEKLGWTLKADHGPWFYVTPPDEERKQWGAVWTYQRYIERIVYIPNWFKDELSKDVFKRDVETALKTSRGSKRWF